MFRSLHPVIKTALFILLVEFVVAPVGSQVFQDYFAGPLKMVRDYLSSFGFLPHGVLIGTAVGLVAALYFLRGGLPDWYKRFDVKRARYDHEKISIQSMLREYLTKDGSYEYVRQKQFYNCKFYGPAMALIQTDCTFGTGNMWSNMGVPLEMKEGAMLTGCVGFQGCHFEGCSFHHITPIIPDRGLDAFIESFNEDLRPFLSLAKGKPPEEAQQAAIEGP